MFASRGFSEARIKCAENEELVVRRPAIADHGHCLVDDLEGICAIWINRPEMSVAYKCTVIATKVSWAARDQAAGQEQQAYDPTLRFHAAQDFATWGPGQVHRAKFP